jgi:hypothetical protein
MFYLLIAKLWLKTLDDKYDLFKLFAYGSVGYVMLHFYLSMKTPTGVLGMLKSSFYYVMVLDFVLAYCLLSQSSQSKEDHIQDDNKLCNDKERMEIIQRIKEANHPIVEKKESIFVPKTGGAVKEKEKEKEIEPKHKVTLLVPHTKSQSDNEGSREEDLPVYKSE